MLTLPKNFDPSRTLKGNTNQSSVRAVCVAVLCSGAAAPDCPDPNSHSKATPCLGGDR